MVKRKLSEDGQEQENQEDSSPSVEEGKETSPKEVNLDDYPGEEEQAAIAPQVSPATITPLASGSATSSALQPDEYIAQQ